MGNDWNMKVARPMNRILRNPRGYLEGHVITSNGIVSVYSQGSATERKHTTLQVVHDGRLYSHGIDQRYSQRGLVMLANRFAEEVSRGQH